MVVDLFLVYQFIRRLATPFNKWKAYDLGIIDEKGKVLIKRKDFTKKAQSEAWGIFDIMIANLKKLLAKVPGGSSKLASYAAALFLIKEYKHFTDESMLTEDLTEEDLEKSLLEFHNRYNHYTMLAEDVNGFLSEKLKKSDDMGTWIKDFYDSDAPQFKGKSKEKRRKMAIAAKLAANEEIHPDVIKAYKRTQDAEHKHGEYGTTATKRAVTRTANTLSKKIKQHHPNLDMQGNIKLRTQLQNMREEVELEEAKKIRWKKAGPNGEIETTVNGVRYKIEKSLDHNERHKGEYKVMIWDKRRESWEWDTTEYGKTNAKARVFFHMNEAATNMRNMKLINKIKKSGVVKSGSMSKQINTKPELEEEPANNVGSGNIAGMDGGHMSRAAQKRWTDKNKSKKKSFKDIIGRT